jgi:hypothetical protein
MPCYLTGRIVIKDIEYLAQSAEKYGFTVEEKENSFLIYLDGVVLYRLDKPIQKLNYESAQKLFKSEIMVQYNLDKIKQAVRKKGMTINKISKEEDKIKIRIKV